MATRHEDWLWQARRDLEHARASAEGSFFEWACFASQQAAAKALKALFQRKRADAWGHSLAELATVLPKDSQAPAELLEAAKELDKHYIPTRYPNALPHGSAGQSYTEGEALRAIDHAEQIIRFCEGHIL